MLVLECKFLEVTLHFEGFRDGVFAEFLCRRELFQQIGVDLMILCVLWV